MWATGSSFCKPAHMRVMVPANSRCICVGSSRDQGVRSTGIRVAKARSVALWEGHTVSACSRTVSSRCFWVWQCDLLSNHKRCHELALDQSWMGATSVAATWREREDWRVVRAVSRLESEMVLLRFFEIPYHPRFLLQELIIQSSKLYSLVFKADWPVLRTMARCENAILPLWNIPAFPPQDGVDIVESEEPSSSLDYAPIYPEIPVCRMESMDALRTWKDSAVSWEPETQNISR